MQKELGMATDKQVEANRRNAQRSTGPQTAEGKANSRGNALKHAMAAETLIPVHLADDFAGRLAQWHEMMPPTTPEECFAVEAVVVCTFRIQECQRNVLAALHQNATRARHAWDVDREAEAAVLMAKLPKRPELVSSQLRATRHGAALMIRTWAWLGESLEAKKGVWSEAEISTALDLLGVPIHQRDGSSPFDPREPDADVQQFRRKFLFKQYEELKTLIDIDLSRVDRQEREDAEGVRTGLKSKDAARCLRYEREAWRRYDTMLGIAKASIPPVVVPPEALIEAEVESDDDPYAGLEEVIQELTEDSTAEEIEAMIEAEIERGGDAERNEPKSRRVPAPHLNRHQRRRQAATARKG
jgi:hypothetical protein